MTVDHRFQHLAALRQVLSVVVYPLQLIVNLPTTTGDWLSENLRSRESLSEENASLRRRQLLMESELQRYQVLLRENVRLRELLDSSIMINNRVLVAELMSADLDPYKQQILINKGSSDGVFPGQPLIDASGVIGQIVHAGVYTSTALLITDASHGLAVEINRTGLRTLAIGSGSINRLRLPHIANEADVRVGDLVVTSGLDGRFPAGYPVGEVTEVELDRESSYARVSLTPNAKLDSGRQVLLIWPDGVEVEPAAEAAQETTETPADTEATAE